jgi:hypothetical protein
VSAGFHAPANVRICGRCGGQLPPYNLSRCLAFCQMPDHWEGQPVTPADRVLGRQQIKDIEEREQAMNSKYEHLVLIRVEVKADGEVALTVVEAGNNVVQLWQRVDDYVHDDAEGTIYRIFNKDANEFIIGSRRVEVVKHAVVR